MPTKNIFERASKQKLRYSTPIGQLTVEDLWDLPLLSTKGPSLDVIAREHNRALREASEESFVTRATTGSTALTLKLDIVKHIIADKLAAVEVAQNAATKRAQKEKILGVLARKEDAALEELDADALRAMVESL